MERMLFTFNKMDVNSKLQVQFEKGFDWGNGYCMTSYSLTKWMSGHGDLGNVAFIKENSSLFEKWRNCF